MRKISKGIGRKAKGREQRDNGWRQVKILDLRLGISDFKKEYFLFYSEIQNLFVSILKRLVGSSCPGVARRAKPEALLQRPKASRLTFPTAFSFAFSLQLFSLQRPQASLSALSSFYPTSFLIF
jgi:hypothetical protein